MHHQIRNKPIQRHSKSQKKYINEVIRKNCCWNCFQLDHLRFQCPYPRISRCSFCRKPYVRSCDCVCSEARRHFHVPEHNDGNSSCHLSEEVKVTEYGTFHKNILVPSNVEGKDTKFVLNENLVVFVENEVQDEQRNQEEEEDKDIIEIHAEEYSLDEI